MIAAAFDVFAESDTGGLSQRANCTDVAVRSSKRMRRRRRGGTRHGEEWQKNQDARRSEKRKNREERWEDGRKKRNEGEAGRRNDLNMKQKPEEGKEPRLSEVV